MHIGFDAISISYAHNISHRQTESFMIHNHPTYELYYFMGGNARFLADGVEYPLEPHTLLVFPPNMFHGIRVYDAEPYERHTLHFTPEAFSLERRPILMRALPRAAQTGGIPCLRKNMEGTAMHALLQMADMCVAQDDQTREKLMSMLTEALVSTILLSGTPAETLLTPDAAHVSSTQEDIITFLNEHFTEAITLDELADRFFLSKHHLNRSFRKVTGTTVRDYLIRKRVTYVQQLLINGVPATQAATLAGFGDYTSFYRAYVKRFGHAPSQDRNPTRTDMNLAAVLDEQIVFTPDAYKMKLEENT